MSGGSASFESRLEYRSVREAAAAADFRVTLADIELDGLAKFEARLRRADNGGNTDRPPLKFPPPLGSIQIWRAVNYSKSCKF